MNGSNCVEESYAVVVMVLAIIIIGSTAIGRIPTDILPIFKTAAVQILTFYPGMPTETVERDITNRLERWTSQANGIARQESKSIIGVSIVKDYFRPDIDPNTAMSQVSSLAISDMYYLPPGTIPPMVMPVAMPVLVSTLTTIVVFFPVIFLYGVGKYLFTPLALSVAFAMAASYVVAMTVVPVAMAVLYRRRRGEVVIGEATEGGGGLHDEEDWSEEISHEEGDKRRGVFAYFERGFEAVRHGYERVLAWSLVNRGKVVTTAILGFAGTLALYPLLGNELSRRLTPVSS